MPQKEVGGTIVEVQAEAEGDDSFFYEFVENEDDFILLRKTSGGDEISF